MRLPARRAVAVSIAVALAATLSACGSSAAQPHVNPATPPAASSSSGTPSTTAPGPAESVSASVSAGATNHSKPATATKTPPTPAQLRAQATATITKLAADQPKGGVSVAAVNTATGAHYSFGAKSGMWTASVYKLLVLETLLLQHGGPLSGSEASKAIPMIENSDNVAGYSLFLDAGGNAALSSAARRLGLVHTVPGRSDPTFTRTSAQDCVTLLKDLAGSGPLSASARSYALGLMRNVEADQRWGVGVVADKGTRFANKNGWLSVDDSNGPGENDDGRWVVNSLGVLTVHGQQVLMAVLTQHQRSFDDGVDLVQALARALLPLVAS